MPEITITLSDGTAFKGELDADGWLVLPRGGKPAKPWFLACEADYGGVYDKAEWCGKDNLRPCSRFTWHCDFWFRIRPLPGHTWESIAAEAKPARDFTDWQEGLGDSTKPEDYDRNPDRYEVQQFHLTDLWGTPVELWHSHLRYRVRLRQPAVAATPPESDEAFLRRVLLARVQAVLVRGDGCTVAVHDKAMPIAAADALRLATLIGGAS